MRDAVNIDIIVRIIRAANDSVAGRAIGKSIAPVSFIVTLLVGDAPFMLSDPAYDISRAGTDGCAAKRRMSGSGSDRGADPGAKQRSAAGSFAPGAKKGEGKQAGK